MRTLTLFAVLSLVALSIPASAADVFEAGLAGVHPEGKERIRQLCHDEAKEEIYATVDGVQSVAIRTGGTSSISNRSSGLSGVRAAYSLGQLGLRYVETSTSGETHPLNKENKPVRHELLNPGPDEFATSFEAPIEVAFENVVVEQTNTFRIVRRIAVVSRTDNGGVLGRRVDFFWLTGSGHSAVRTNLALCPTTTARTEYQPEFFLSSVINPNSYTCYRDTLRTKDQIEAQFRQAMLANGASSQTLAPYHQIRSDAEKQRDVDFYQCIKKYRDNLPSKARLVYTKQ